MLCEAKRIPTPYLRASRMSTVRHASAAVPDLRSCSDFDVRRFYLRCEKCGWWFDGRYFRRGSADFPDTFPRETFLPHTSAWIEQKTKALAFWQSSCTLSNLIRYRKGVNLMLANVLEKPATVENSLHDVSKIGSRVRRGGGSSYDTRLRFLSDANDSSILQKAPAGKQTARQLPVVPRRCRDHSRNTRAGSVRVARQAGRRQAATEVIVITATADANASGSFGLTL